MVINPILSYHPRHDYIDDDDDDDNGDDGDDGDDGYDDDGDGDYDDDDNDDDNDDAHDDDETIAVTSQVAVNLAPSLCLCQLTPHPQAAQYKVSTSAVDNVK